MQLLWPKLLLLYWMASAKPSLVVWHPEMELRGRSPSSTFPVAILESKMAATGSGVVAILDSNMAFQPPFWNPRWPPVHFRSPCRNPRWPPHHFLWRPSWIPTRRPEMYWWPSWIPRWLLEGFLLLRSISGYWFVYFLFNVLIETVSPLAHVSLISSRRLDVASTSEPGDMTAIIFFLFSFHFLFCFCFQHDPHLIFYPLLFVFFLLIFFTTYLK